jgi:F-type H+-transporting ATPase subunit a
LSFFFNFGLLLKRVFDIMWKKQSLTILLLFGLMLARVGAQDDNQHESNSNSHEEDKVFNPGTFILDHVMDSYDWHILTVGDTHISIPLPVILISKSKGFHIFLSSRFHHGHSAYKGFMIAQDGPNEGSIVEVDEHGHVDENAKLPLDFSITKTVFAMLISFLLMIWIFLSVAKRYKKNPNRPPKGIQALMEPIILFVRDDIAIPSIGEKRYERFMPYLLTVFFFIILNNYLGVIPFPPGGANVTGNIAVTAVLALLTFIITTFSTNKGYWKHIFNAPGVPWWLKFPVPLMPFIELLGVFTKPLVLCIRLFANILAGHFIILSFVALIFIFGQIHWIAGYGVSFISVLFYVFMTLLEFLVAFIQAYVFTLLSALYFGMAKEEAH